jgi:hypothetical protein
MLSHLLGQQQVQQTFYYKISMFINSDLIRKMGWVDYSRSRGIGPNYRFFEEDGDVQYFILFEERKKCFVIKQQKVNNIYNDYKFISVDFSKKRLKIKSKIFNSNIELLSLIRENLACNLSYQRLFQINSILK